MGIMLLCWESPWPAYGGGSLRTLGLLRELSKVYSVELLVLSAKPLSGTQEVELRKYAKSVTRVPMVRDTRRVLSRMTTGRMPYHCALLDLSFRGDPGRLRQLHASADIIYASYGHWGTLVRHHSAANWILDQQNADVDFWRVYATQATSWWLKMAAYVNWRLSAVHFPPIYRRVGRIVSVCEADRQLTLDLAPQAEVDVIANGVDCGFYIPNKVARSGPPRLLFTGTSAPRNVTALRSFMRNVWPMVQKQVPDVELLVAGNFRTPAQAEFSGYSGIRFTGWVEDIRPYFEMSDVFVAPFHETHGSKLKIAEALAMGMPIVSTPQGIRGFALVDDESALIARTNEQFATQCVSLLRDHEKRGQLGGAARDLALSTLDWPVLGRRVVESVEATRRALQ
jgi:polysaccharide biosynthesis protein PslH